MPRVRGFQLVLGGRTGICTNTLAGKGEGENRRAGPGSGRLGLRAWPGQRRGEECEWRERTRLLRRPLTCSLPRHSANTHLVSVRCVSGTLIGTGEINHDLKETEAGSRQRKILNYLRYVQ